MIVKVGSWFALGGQINSGENGHSPCAVRREMSLRNSILDCVKRPVAKLSSSERPSVFKVGFSAHPELNFLAPPDTSRTIMIGTIV